VTLAVSSSSSIRAPEGGNPQNLLNYSKKRHQGMKRILGIGVEVDCSDRVGSVEGKATFSPSTDTSDLESRIDQLVYAAL
jgi:hypothetical protein